MQLKVGMMHILENEKHRSKESKTGERQSLKITMFGQSGKICSVINSATGNHYAVLPAAPMIRTAGRSCKICVSKVLRHIIKSH